MIYTFYIIYIYCAMCIIPESGMDTDKYIGREQGGYRTT